METGTATAPMAKKTAPQKTEVTKLDASILRDARIVVAVTGEGLGEYLNRILRPIVTRDKEKAIKQESSPEPAPKR